MWQDVQFKEDGIMYLVHFHKGSYKLEVIVASRFYLLFDRINVGKNLSQSLIKNK